MKRLWTLPLLGLLISCTEAQDVAQGSATYTVVAPNKLRPNMDYHVSVSMHDIQSATDVTVSITGPADTGNYNSVSRVITVNPRETQILKFEIGEWGSGKYNLTVSGIGGLTFRNETALQYEHKSYSVFIQTDKAIYKPGQLVQFRVIVVNPYLLPSVTGAIDMHVTDSNGNRIKQWNRVFTTRGIVSAEIQLSDQPVLGDWTIHVDVLGQIFKKSFTVAEYVLPTFEVKVLLPPFVTYNKSDVVATIKATYTYGKPVKGELTLTVRPRTRYNFLSVRPYESYQTKLQINGSVDVPLNLRRDMSLKTDLFEREIEFFALVTEELTGRKYNSTSTMKIYEKEIKMELVKMSESFKPGLKFPAFLKVAYQDDTPVNDKSHQLKLRYGYSYDEDLWKTAYFQIPQNGLINLDFYPPNTNELTTLVIKAEYRGLPYTFDPIHAARSPSNNFIQVILLTENPSVGSEVELEVNATEPLTQLVYEVSGRGDLVFARSLAFPQKNSNRFKFPVSHRMAPRAQVIVYYVRGSNNEVVADSLSFEVDGTFRTDVSIHTDVKETKPGSKVDVRVTTKPFAFIGVLGLDQSILLLKTGNDITQQQVIDELESYDSAKKTKRPPWQVTPRSLWWPGSASAGKIFEDSGVVILTNGLVHRMDDMPQPRFHEPGIHLDENVLTHPMLPPTGLPEAPPPLDGRIVLRKQFPETWLWSNATTGNDGMAVISSKVPDTITSWIISAFAMDPINGLGIAPSTAKVTVFRPFFVSLNLPYSVLRGESVAIQAVVFNYNNKPIQAEVILENRKSEFEFTTATSDASGNGYQEQKKKVIMVPGQDGASVSFLITPRKLGYTDIKVTASSQTAGDSVLKKLLVKPEGSTQYFNKAVLVDLRNPTAGPITANVSVPIPKNAIQGSERVTVSAIGDLLGPHVNNLDQLLHMPFGCGEQNMLRFVPNIVALDYLTRSNRLTAPVKNKALRFLENGYQRELTYKRDDGSFSAFGNSDKNGSTWLTAFVVKSFQQAKPYIDIDEEVLDNAIKWLVQRQKSDGSFEEPGTIHYQPMQGGSGTGAALAAYVLIALLESQAQRSYRHVVELAEQYLVRELRMTDDPYAAAIATYAMHLADSQFKDNAFQKLHRLAVQEDEVLYWTKGERTNVTDKQSDYFYLPPSQDVEMTAYALMSYTLRSDFTNAVSIMKWLVSQQNENGGFASTQDTVIGIQAMAQLAARIVSSTISVDVNFKYDEGRTKSLKVTSENAMMLQRLELPPTTRYVEIEASGNGFALVQVSWTFNLAVSGEAPSFFLNPLLDKTSSESYLQLSVCTHYKDEGQTNMAVMEVALPSGYLADNDALSSIHRTPEVKRVETRDGDTSVVIYFDKIGKDELCLTVPAHRTFKVANQKPVPVKLYDYYNLAKSTRMFYHPHKATLCDVCEGDECGDSCTKQADNESDKLNVDGSNVVSASVVTVIAILSICVLL